MEWWIAANLLPSLHHSITPLPFLPKDPPSPHAHLSPRQAADNRRIQLMFRRLDALVKRFWSVLVEDGDGGLRNNRSGIHPGINKMHRASGHLDSMLQRLFPRFQTR